MRNNFITRSSFAALLAVLFFGIAFCCNAGSNADVPLCVMTYNLRFANMNKGEAWPDRRPLMHELIQKISPDVFGTQEGVYHQLKDLATDLTEYDWIGTGRDGGSRGEFMAIFFKRAELDPLEYDHFWLSDTPDVIGSTTWGNSNRRMVTWVKFRHRASGREFYFWDTHLDHRIQEAREKSATLIRERIEKLNTKLPIILVGDFNAVAETNKAYKILTAGDFFMDTWKTSPKRIGEGLDTFNGFKAVEKHGRRIDWILTRGPIAPESIEINTFSKNGQFPSDHCPVVTKVKLGAP